MKRRIFSNAIYRWRHYDVSREDYLLCIDKVLAGNLFSLWPVSFWFTVFCFIYSILSIIPAIGDDALLSTIGINATFYLDTTFFYFLVSIAAAAFTFFMHRLHHQSKKGRHISKFSIYVYIILLYSSIVLAGIYMDVWTNPNGAAIISLAFIVCAIFTIAAPPGFNLFLVLAATAVLIISSVLIKDAIYWGADIMNVSAIAPAAIAFNWFGNVYKMQAVLNEHKLAQERDKYQSQSIVDELTGLKNRRDFAEKFERYLTRYRDTDVGKHLCLAIIDIDHFKDYNDHYGHPQGDECLRAIGGALASLSKSTNTYAARLGGEEFALLWFEKDEDGIKNIVSQIQQCIKDLNIPHVKSITSPRVTVSIGVHTILCGTSTSTEAIYSLSDKALYDAKANGRNCAVVIHKETRHHILAS